MMKHFLGLLAILFCLLLTSCKNEEVASCKKIMYVMDDEIEVITYQFMTQTEAEATFSKYKNVRIFSIDCDQPECLMKNFE